MRLNYRFDDIMTIEFPRVYYFFLTPFTFIKVMLVLSLIVANAKYLIKWSKIYF